MKTYHVAKVGSDLNKGTKDAPFLTINKAAREAEIGNGCGRSMAGAVIRNTLYTGQQRGNMW